MTSKKGITHIQAQVIRKRKGLSDSNLLKMRLKKGVSQGDLAIKSGVSKNTIQCYEQRQRNIDTAKLETICDLCLALDCRLEDILEDKKVIKKIRLVK